MKTNINKVIQRVADYYGLKLAELTRRGREEPRTTIRAVTMLLLREAGVSDRETSYAMGLWSGGASWTMSKRIAVRAEVDGVLADDIENIRNGRRSDVTVASVMAEQRAAAAAARMKRNLPQRGHRLPRARCGVAEDRSYRTAGIETWHGPDILERENGVPGFGSLAQLNKLLSV